MPRFIFQFIFTRFSIPRTFTTFCIYQISRKKKIIQTNWPEHAKFCPTHTKITINTLLAHEITCPTQFFRPNTKSPNTNSPNTQIQKYNTPFSPKHRQTLAKIYLSRPKSRAHALFIRPVRIFFSTRPVKIILCVCGCLYQKNLQLFYAARTQMGSRVSPLDRSPLFVPHSIYTIREQNRREKPHSELMFFYFPGSPPNREAVL